MAQTPLPGPEKAGFSYPLEQAAYSGIRPISPGKVVE
jgi:hypothetical protein